MRKDVQQFAAQAYILFLQRRVLQRPVNGEFQLLDQFVRLDHILVGAQIERVDGRFHTGIGRDQDERGGIPGFAEKLEQFDA